MPDIQLSYNTWHQFVRAADATTGLNPNHRTSRDSTNGSWAGTANWPETMDLATYGWAEGRKQVKDRINIIERFISPRQPRMVLTHSVRGPGILDLERYQQGRPDSWVVWEAMEDAVNGRSAKIVPIVFNVSASSGISKETMFARGAAVCALADILEHSGIRVEIVVAELTKYSSGTHLFKVIVKHAEDPLDLDRVVFALCNASVLRRLMFSIAEQFVPNLDASYGQPRTYTEEGAIVLDGMSTAIRADSDIVPWLVQQLANYGIEVEV